MSTCVEIHKLSVPSLVKYGTMGEVFLDCDFDHSEEEEKNSCPKFCAPPTPPPSEGDDYTQYGYGEV